MAFSSPTARTPLFVFSRAGTGSKIWKVMEIFSANGNKQKREGERERDKHKISEERGVTADSISRLKTQNNNLLFSPLQVIINNH